MYVAFTCLYNDILFFKYKYKDILKYQLKYLYYKCQIINTVTSDISNLITYVCSKLLSKSLNK